MVCNTRKSRRGFTLIEAALTTMIVGVGLVATLQLLATGTAANIDGTNLTTAVNLAKNVRELTLKKTFAEVRALNRTYWTPPKDSRGEDVVGFDTWSQAITVQSVDRDRLTLDVVDANPQGVRVTVRVAHNGNEVFDLSWYRFKPMP